MLKFEALLAFAKDAVSCMAYFYKDSWIASKDKVKSPFVNVMGEAMIRFSLHHREWLNRVAEEAVYRIDENPDEFFEFGYELADLLFEDQPFMELIAICSFITYVSHVLFIMGKRQFMDKAYFMIATLFLKLRDRFEAEGGFKEFQLLCLEYALMIIKDGKVKRNYSKMNGKLPAGIQTSIRIIKQSLLVYQKSTEAIPEESTHVIAESIETLLESSTVITESIETIPESPGVVTESTGTIPESPGVVTESTETIPESSGVVTESTGTISESNREVQKSTSDKPESTGARRKVTIVDAKQSDTMHKSCEETSRSTGAIPKLRKLTGVTRKVTIMDAKQTDTMHKLTGEIARSTGAIPKVRKSTGADSTGATRKVTIMDAKQTDTMHKSTGEIERTTEDTPKLQKPEADTESSDPDRKSTGSIKKSINISRNSTGKIPITIEEILESSWDDGKPSKNKFFARRQMTKPSPVLQSKIIFVRAYLITEEPNWIRKKLNKKVEILQRQRTFLLRSQQKQLTNLLGSHKRQLTDLLGSHQTPLTSLLESHQRQLTNLIERHQRQLTSLLGSHQKRLMSFLESYQRQLTSLPNILQPRNECALKADILNSLATDKSPRKSSKSTDESPRQSPKATNEFPRKLPKATDESPEPSTTLQ